MSKISFSKADTHRACPQKYGYRYIEGLVPDDANVAECERIFGLFWHALMAADSIERGVAAGTLKMAPTALQTLGDGMYEVPTGETNDKGEYEYYTNLVERVADAADAYTRTLSEEHSAEFVSRLGGSLSERIKYTYNRWQEMYAEVQETEHPIAVEMPVSRAVPIEEPLEFRGYIDEVYLDTVRDVVCVRDHKTHKSLSQVSTIDTFFESQLHLYAWAAAPQLHEWGYGDPAMIQYARVRMTAPKEPKITLTGTLSKSVSDYDLHTYLSWVGEGVPFEGRKKDGSGAGVYTAEPTVIERLESPAEREKWFMRATVPVSRATVIEHLRGLKYTNEDIGRTEQRWPEGHSVGRNFSRACQWCPFAELCKTSLTGGSVGEFDYHLYGLKVKNTTAK